MFGTLSFDILLANSFFKVDTSDIADYDDNNTPCVSLKTKMKF